MSEQDIIYEQGIYGLGYSESESKVIYLPVPWDATASYGDGAHAGPQAMFNSSFQLDFFDPDVDRPYRHGLFMRPISKEIEQASESARKAAKHIMAVDGKIDGNSELQAALKSVNEASERVNVWVREQASGILKAGKVLGVLGGDHSSPYGAFQAVAEKEGVFGILHFDAHCDLRKAYHGFIHSHASIMRNVLESIPEVSRLVQVGIRDFCEEENAFVKSQGSRVALHTDRALKYALYEGATWASLCERILEPLPDKVWVSFDIDGLDPRYCPNTGTPVPGGLDFSEAVFLISMLARSGRKIIGFDLCEVAPGAHGDEWDGNVGMRLLYQLTAWTLESLGVSASSRPRARY